MYVELGNGAAKQAKRTASGEPERDEDGFVVHEPIAGGGARVTRVEIPEGTPLAEAFVSITQPVRGVWANHSDEAPEWVESDSDGLAALLAEHFGCKVGRPRGWKGVDVDRRDDAEDDE